METPDTTPAVPLVTPPPADAVTAKLTALGVDADTVTKIKELGVTTEDDLSSLTEDDLKGAGMKPIPARKLAGALKPTVAAPASAPSASAMATVSFDAVLPSVPADASWLEALRTGGVLKVDQSTVISAIRAALAYKAGLYGIPERLVGLMEDFSETLDEPVGADYFKLRRDLTRRSYADIFEAIPGLDGNYVTDKRKKALLDRVDNYLWAAIVAFFDQLKSWQETWVQGASNPMLIMNAFMAHSGSGMAMPAGMMQPPDTGNLRDHADAVADSVNKVFAGPGVQIAAALAYEASKVKETLENPALPAMIGAANRDQMLKQLGVSVSATYPRLERNLTQFTLGVMRLKDQAAGNEELQYLGALFMLGSQIPWDQLGGRVGTGPVTGIGGRRPNGRI